MIELQISQQRLSTERIADILTDAFEGGSNSWYQIEGYVDPTRWEFDSEPRRGRPAHWDQDYALNPGGAVLISDRLDREHGTMRLDAASLQNGLITLAAKYPFHLEDILIENDDAITADAYLQCCLFGDIIYG